MIVICSKEKGFWNVVVCFKFLNSNPDDGPTVKSSCQSEKQGGSRPGAG